MSGIPFAVNSNTARQAPTPLLETAASADAQAPGVSPVVVAEAHGVEDWEAEVWEEAALAVEAVFVQGVVFNHAQSSQAEP